MRRLTALKIKNCRIKNHKHCWMPFFANLRVYEHAAALDAMTWWDWDHDTLTERLPDFRDVRAFLAKYAP